ncbi:MAG: DUF881 domain-containing protein [Actinobacteria bacterium]|nr:DUF881 domain-containing protein [Actinomycetota bacterium]
MSARRQPKHRPKLGAMSVSLLNELFTHTLDRGYAEAAARRAGPGQPSRTVLRSHLQIAAGLLLVGLVLSTAYQQTRRQAPESTRVKRALIQDIGARTKVGHELARRADALSAKVAGERNAVLAATAEGNAARTRLQYLEERTGSVAVVGPGLVVAVGDAASRQQVDPITGQQRDLPPEESGRITDRDLQLLVNELWATGAEAIAVDGRRLAPTTTIREAGGAILVDYFPVASPYLINAVGDPDVLLPRFADSRIGQQFQTYVGAYGIRFDLVRAESLTLAAATGTELRYARPDQGAGGTPTQAPPPTPAGGPSSFAPPDPTRPTDGRAGASPSGGNP